jgi:hypothetical protein
MSGGRAGHRDLDVEAIDADLVLELAAELPGVGRPVEDVGIAPKTPSDAPSKPARATPTKSLAPPTLTPASDANQRAYERALALPLDDCFVAGGAGQHRGWPVLCQRVDGSKLCFFASFEVGYTNQETLAPGAKFRYLIDDFPDLPLNAADEAHRRRAGTWDPQHIVASYDYWSGRNVLRVLCTYRNADDALRSVISLHAQFPTVADSSGFADADEDVLLLEARVLTNLGASHKLLIDVASGKTSVLATRWTVLEALLRCPCVVAGGRIVKRMGAKKD